MPPLWRECTVEKLAVNAVMAGCEPAYFPVIVAAAQAMLDPAFNLYGVQATTHPVAPLIVVNGPYAHAIGLHAGSGLFGPGFRANATIGRAIRLILLNIGGGWPGRHDMATQGSPAKFSLRDRRARGRRPWEPLHVGLGFKADQSVVTVYGGEGPHNVNDHVSTTAAGHPQQRGRRARPRSAPTSAGTCRRASSWSCSGPSTPRPSRPTGSPARTCSASSSSTRACRSAA